ncbi:uncharacterized protein [Halyomorpha halys]|nr:uncharacterized protein LOC106680122 isoform X2 [Halyomorpha halys]XP_014275116.1 uncharacterized protein LOC106680122 isoform X2 [Halyomorpha halys]
MDKEVLEVVLKKLAKESSIASITEIEAVPALPKGENYSSNILRLTLKVVLGNGRMAKKSLIMKQIITGGDRGELLKHLNVAKEESKIYSVIHKEMSYLMEEFEDTDEPLWCNFIHYDPDLCCILLEDLKSTGYSLVPRQKGMDFHHAVLALRGLGRYHGMAKVLEERGFVSKHDYIPYGFFTNLKIVKAVPYAGILNTAKAIRESWGSHWKETARKLMISFDPFAAKHMQSVQVEKSEFTCLNHGDCWSNNMMFKYDFQKRPIAVKFLDYQMPHHNTPCVDVTNFFYLSIQPGVRRSNYALLVKAYHDSLSSSLEKFGFTGTKPTLEEITATMKRLEFFGLTIFVSVYPAVVCSSVEAFDFEKLLKTDGQEGFNPDVLTEPGLIEKMGPDIIDFTERHTHDLY